MLRSLGLRRCVFGMFGANLSVDLHKHSQISADAGYCLEEFWACNSTFWWSQARGSLKSLSYKQTGLRLVLDLLIESIN